MNSLKEGSVSMVDEILDSHKFQEVNHKVDDPVVFLKDFFRRKEFKPQK